MHHVDHQLIDLIEGHLDKEVQGRVERHLAECSLCREAWETVTSAATVPQAPKPFVSPEYFTSILPRVRERLAEQQPWIQRIFGDRYVERLVMPLTFAIIGAIALSHVSLLGPVSNDQTRRLDIAPQEITEFISTIDATSTNEFASATGLDDRLLLSHETSMLEASTWEEIDPTALSEVLDALEDDEAQELITRLGKRTTL